MALRNLSLITYSALHVSPICKKIAVRYSIPSTSLFYNGLDFRVKNCPLKKWVHLSAMQRSPENIESCKDKKRVELEQWLESERLSGKYIPENINEEQMTCILSAKTLSQRRKCVFYLIRKEKFYVKNKENKKKRKERRKNECEERLKLNSSQHIHYGLWKNCMFAKMFKPARADLEHHRLLSAVINNQPLILDLGFGKHMNLIEQNILSREIISCIHLNQKSSDPFNLTICNADFESDVIEKICNILPNSFPMNISEKSYLDLYPKDKLVYLTPDAETEMSEFDFNSIYILGGIVDHGDKYPLTFAKANEAGIKTMKFPLERYLPNSKKQEVLDIGHAAAILLELQETGDWAKAFQHIPEYYRRSIKCGDKEVLGKETSLRNVDAASV